MARAAAGLCRRCLALAALAAIAGCGSGTEEQAAAPQPPAGIEARFIAGHSVNVISVTTVDPLALRSAVLKGPGGVDVPAYSIDTTRSPGEALTPGGGAFPPTPGMPVTRTSVHTIVSTALIELPEPVLYVHDWRQYRIHLRLASPGGEARDVILPAPAPPANEGG